MKSKRSLLKFALKYDFKLRFHKGSIDVNTKKDNSSSELFAVHLSIAKYDLSISTGGVRIVCIKERLGL